MGNDYRVNGKMRLRKVIIGISILALVALVLPLGITLATSLTGLDTLLSLNRTGVDDSWSAITRSGVAESRLIMTTAFIQLLPPTGLTLTAVGVGEVSISWTKGVGAENTMVRGAIGHLPVDRDDGYLVYYGTGTSATDYADIGQEIVWYRAWSRDSGDTWEDEGVWGSIGGTMVIFMLFGMLGLGLLFGFIWKKYGFLAYGAAGVWGLLGFLALTTSSSSSPAQITDVYMGLFWLCMAFVIGCSLLPTVMREKRSKDDLYVDEIDEVTGEPVKKKEEKPKRNRTRTSFFAKRGR